MSDECIRKRVMAEKACEHHSDRTTVGVEVPTVYDGILFWLCETCGAMWHRFGTAPANAWLRNRAQRVMERWERRANAEPVSEAGEGGSATAPADVPKLG